MSGKIPRHVAIIMDGNGRWARKRFLPRTAGHKKGVDTVRSTIESCAEKGVEVLTLFAFSSENWQRPEEEVSTLMALFMSALKRETRRLKKNGIKLLIIGDKQRFPEKLREQMEIAESDTADGTRMVLQIAANYGGRADILGSVKQLGKKIAKGEVDPESLTEESISDHLWTAGKPDPDLFIRTGGDTRISNFLLWQLAYAELYFTEKLWPEFKPAELQKAFDSFNARERRYGMTSEQVATNA
ncbi:MAG TPA: di-trans,poly-cis-decaprenylcistransferase [Gammaproteobacteria bacterium]|jgi:undecaprenyl diphosphate synthase|nr:di-trans,poly-cis-decaprenylcistransferase [Gammaproteobacteria bacterium]